MQVCEQVESKGGVSAGVSYVLIFASVFIAFAF